MIKNHGGVCYMKTITILTYPRTGSTWLSHALGGNDTFSTTEIFCLNPLKQYWNILFLLKNIYGIDKHILSLFETIYHPKHFFINTQILSSITKNINDTKPYSKDILQAIQRVVYDKRYNLTYKIFVDHMKSLKLDIAEVEQLSDYIVINYRNDMLASYISLEKGIISGRWCSMDTIPYQNKMEWNIELYNVYMQKTLSQINRIFALAELLKQTPCVVLSYEAIHSHQKEQDKINYINQNFINVDPHFSWSYSDHVLLQKENLIGELADNFYNPEQFLLDLPNIRRYYLDHQPYA